MPRYTVKIFMLACVVLSATALSAAGQDETLLLRQPTVSANYVTFVYAGDIWLADRDGGDAKRLTVHKGIESEPAFSPDGAWIAFTGNYDGNVDVYVVSVKGGSPRRLTFHPDSDYVRGWSPDGEGILFISYRNNPHWYGRLYTVSREGGFPELLPIPQAERAVYSPDGRRIAYTPIRDAFYTWRRYRGGLTAPSFAIVSPDGEWEVENEGVWPDIEVEMTPKLVIEGHDPQLGKAVQVVLEELERSPVTKVERPPYPTRAK